MNRQNRKRGLADVVGVEAWHRPFTGKSREAPLHIDVVFQTGRFGAEGPQIDTRDEMLILISGHVSLLGADS